MKKPADKMSLRYLPEVCRSIREKAHNRFMASRASEFSPVQDVRYVPGLYPPAAPPTPPPFLPHAYQNNQVTSKKPKVTCKNKQLASRILSAVRVDSSQTNFQRLSLSRCIGAKPGGMRALKGTRIHVG